MRDLDNPEDLTRFLEIKATIKELEEELEPLKDRIIYALMGEDGQKFQHGDNLLSLSYRKTYDWDSIPEIENLNLNLKFLKEKHKKTVEVKKDQAILTVRFHPVDVSRRDF